MEHRHGFYRELASVFNQSLGAMACIAVELPEGKQGKLVGGFNPSEKNISQLG